MASPSPRLWVRAPATAPGNAWHAQTAAGLPPRGPAWGTIELDPAPATSIGGRLLGFMRALQARNRDLRIHAVAPTLMSSALQESQPLAVETAGVDWAVVDGAGLLLPAVGSLLAAGSFGLTMKGAWDAKQAEASLRPAREDAVAALQRCAPGPEEAAARAALKRLCGEIGFADTDGRRPRCYLGSHRVPPSSLTAAHSAAVEGVSVPTIAAIVRRRAEDELARLDARRDRGIAAHAVGYLAHLESCDRDSRAQHSLMGNVLACVRDVGIDMPGVGYDALTLLDSVRDGPLELLLGAADAPSYGFGALAGAMQVGCGVVELRHARRQHASLQELGTLVGGNVARLAADGKRGARIDTPLAHEARSQFESARRIDIAHAWRRRGLAWLRIGYGLLTFAASATGAGMLLLLGATMVVGTGGLALLVFSAVVGLSWVGVTGYRMLGRAHADSIRRNERDTLARALEAGARRGLTAASLDACTPAQLEALRRLCPALEGNRYLLAALLARRLVIDPRDRTCGKQARVETATLLQALGMPRLWTTMLKRAPFEWALRHIDAYLNGDMAVLALQRGELAAWRAPDADAGSLPGPAAPQAVRTLRG